MKIIKWPKWYVFLSSIFVMLFLIYNYKSPSSIQKEKYENDVKLNIICIVADKYIDHTNHNYKTCIIKHDMDSIRFLMDFDKSALFDYLKVGDSIIKKPGEARVRVIREFLKREFVLMY